MQPFWAHSDPAGLPMGAADANWQPLSEHLDAVSKLARSLAAQALPHDSHFQDLADWSGLLHDYGKYTDCFQQMITTGRGKCPHAIHGAAVALEGIETDTRLWSAHIALAIAGHHAGIPDIDVLKDNVKQKRQEAIALLENASRDLPRIGSLLNHQPPPPRPTQTHDLVTRMLLSCLVDADRLDTAGRSSQQSPLNAKDRLAKLLNYIDDLAAKSPEGVVKQARREVLEDCLNAAALDKEIYSLSVPTGGGKTLSSMAFALKRAALHPDRYRRVIVVIPYLSIIEQNAEVYARVFGSDSILEHHSGSFARLTVKDDNHFAPIADQSEQYRSPASIPETENWDAPLIVTTSVRFFESLFSNHPSDLRRIHNIARSIVILDEVQVLPKPLLAPLLAMIDELCSDWGCSFVLATATQPAFEKPPHKTNDRRWAQGKLHEIVRSPAALHNALRRVSIDWRIRNPVDWPEVAAWMLEHSQALCVVNLREHAATLFDELSARITARDAVFHLSTRMCAAHRLQVITTIRDRLKQELPCLVVSTQLIEAGVDLDFPVAFRALGPLDSIVQVAGRADREGRLTAEKGTPGGLLIVFKPVDHRTPPNEYALATGITETLALSNSQPPQPADLQALNNFFESYYGTGDLGEVFLDFRKWAKFKTLSDEFEMISSRTREVFVPFGEGRKLLNQLRRIRHLTGDLRRSLQRYTVGLQPYEFEKARNGVLMTLDEENDIWTASDAAYSKDKGLQLTLSAEALIG